MGRAGTHFVSIKYSKEIIKQLRKLINLGQRGVGVFALKCGKKNTPYAGMYHFCHT
jgi:hypothetical protein